MTAAFRFIGMDWKLTGRRGVVGIRRRAASGARAHLPLLHGVVAKDRAEDHKRNPGEWSDEEADHQETEQKVDHRQHPGSSHYQDGSSGCFMAGSVSLSLEESGRSARARDGGGIGRAA